MSEPSVAERDLANALGDTDVSDAAVQGRLAALRADIRFTNPDRWLALARDERLPAWRRLAAYRLLLSRSLRYPMPLAAFARMALAPLGADAGAMVDMSMAQVVPVERRDDAVIRMIHVPIETAVGSAAVYLSLDPALETVLEAGLSPMTDAPEEG